MAVADLLSLDKIKDLAPNSSPSFNDLIYFEFTKKSTLPCFIINNLSPTSP